jgi:hypothetical protein
MIDTTIYFGGTVLYIEPHLRIIDLLSKWKNDIKIKQINCASSGCIFGLVLCDNLIENNGNFLIKDTLKIKSKKWHYETKNIINNTTLNNIVNSSLIYIYENTSDDIHLKCSNILNIYYTIINNNGIAEQISKNKWKSKNDLLSDIYRSMSIYLITIKEILYDD